MLSGKTKKQTTKKTIKYKNIKSIQTWLKYIIYDMTNNILKEDLPNWLTTEILSTPSARGNTRFDLSQSGVPLYHMLGFSL